MHTERLLKLNAMRVKCLCGSLGVSIHIYMQKTFHIHTHTNVFLILKYSSDLRCSVRDTAILTNCVRELILQRCGCHFGCRESPCLRHRIADFRLGTAFWQSNVLDIGAKGDRLLSACRNVNCNCISPLNSRIQWH